MRQTHAMEIAYAVHNLHEGAGDFLSGHSPSHYRRKQVVRRVLHDLEPPAILLDNIQGFNDISMVKCRTNAELCCDFFRIVFLSFPRVLLAKLFHGKSDTITAPFEKSNRTACATAKNLTKFAVLCLQAMVIGEGYICWRGVLRGCPASRFSTCPSRSRTLRV